MLKKVYFYLLVKNVLLTGFCCYIAFLVTSAEETEAPLVAGFTAVVLFLGVVTIMLAGFFGWFNRQLPGRVVNLVQGDLFAIFQILFLLFWVLIWFTYLDINRTLELLALGETAFSFLPIYIISHSIPINQSSKNWERGVIFDVFITYIELIGTLFDTCLSFLTAMQSLLLTGIVVVLFSKIQLFRLPKAGDKVDYVFHLGGVFALMTAMIGVSAGFITEYPQILMAGIIASIFSLFYVYRLFGEMTRLYIPSKLHEVLAWKVKASNITKKGLIAASIVLLLLVIFIR
jgi:hypothetical protein